MEKLPNELFDPIVAHLGAQVDDRECRTGLASLRFLNRYLANAVVPHLFQKVPFGMSDKSLETLSELSKTPKM